MDDADTRALANKVSALYRAACDAEAEALLRAALGKYPNNAELWYGLATVRLVQGDFREGFRAWEARPERRQSSLNKLPYPEWTGDPLCGRSILVCGEQGIGDEIMFARFLPDLRRLGASRISVVGLSANLRLFEQFHPDAIYPRDAGTVNIPRHDCWIMLGSLPHRLGVTLRHLSGAPYLSATPAERGGVGIVERGRPTHVNDANRSLPPGTLGDVLPTAWLLEPVGDVLDSLSVVAGLELLVTVDTSWAHIAGALGVPCWVLLPAHGQDWRWLRYRADSPWYGSLRLFRQVVPGDWECVVREVATKLAAHMKR